VVSDGGGLLFRSFTGLLKVDRGFQAERIITVNFSLPPSHYRSQEQRVAAVALALEAPSVVSGADSVGLINRLPLSVRAAVAVCCGRRNDREIGTSDGEHPSGQR